MIPKIHDKGSSFKGIAQYVLHDIKAETSHRVGWTETINLGTKNPHTAHRVMAATAMDAARLKRQAGVRNTGRKSKDVVMHVSLSWHPDEAKDLSKGEMLRAARWFLREIKADDLSLIHISHTVVFSNHASLLPFPSTDHASCRVHGLAPGAVLPLARLPAPNPLDASPAMNAAGAMHGQQQTKGTNHDTEL